MSGSKRISELTVTTTPSGNDRVVVLTNPASSAQTQTTTITSLTNNLRYANTTVSGVIKVGNNLSTNATGFLNATINAGIKWTKLIDTTTPYTVAANDEVIICDPNAAGGDITINFPNTNTEGKLFTVKNINNGGHNCYVKIADLSSKLEIPGTGTLNSNNNLNASGKFATWIYSSGAYRCIGSGS